METLDYKTIFDILEDADKYIDRYVKVNQIVEEIKDFYYRALADHVVKYGIERG